MSNEPDEKDWRSIIGGACFIIILVIIAIAVLGYIFGRVAPP